MPKLSILIPSRNEAYLYPTIRDCFAKAAGEIEVVVHLDGYWPQDWKTMTDAYPNLHTVHSGEAVGMRPGINKAAGSAISRGAKYLFKLDAHCMLDEGYDLKLQADMDHDWIVVPRRKRLDAEKWELQDVGKPDIDYHYLSFPNDPDDWGGPGLNGKPWTQRILERLGKPEYDIDDECSSQGSAWLMTADYFQKLELMDAALYGPFWNEAQELFLKCWLSGGRGVTNKKTWYAHLRKGKEYEGADGKKGRGYTLPESWLKSGRDHTMKWIWNEAWDKQTRPFKWLIDKFPNMPGWPDNWEEILYATRKPRLVGAGGSDTRAAGDTSDSREDVPDVSLKIHEAYYGVGVHHTSTQHPDKFLFTDNINVTERLQSLVKNDSLDIVVNNSTLQVGNPFRGKKKILIVTYSYSNSNPVTVERWEKDWLIIGPAMKDGVNLLAAQSSEKYNLPHEAGYHGDRFARLDESAAKIESHLEQIMRVTSDPPHTAAALNDYLIRRFSISPQRLRGPMPIELRDFHRNDLAQLFAELGFKRGAEIGVAEGNYSEVLLKANPECELLLIDPWHAYSENPQNKTKEKHEFAYNEVVRKTKNYPNVEIRQAYSMDAVEGILYGELDFVYVDACHLFDYCVMDIIEWSKRVRSGGIISGDDYYALDQKRWVGGGVVEAVQAYVNAHRIPVWWIFQGHKSTDFMWVRP